MGLFNKKKKVQEPAPVTVGEDYYQEPEDPFEDLDEELPEESESEDEFEEEEQEEQEPEQPKVTKKVVKQPKSKPKPKEELKDQSDELTEESVIAAFNNLDIRLRNLESAYPQVTKVVSDYQQRLQQLESFIFRHRSV